MKKCILIAIALFSFLHAASRVAVSISHPQLPIVVDRENNIVAEIEIDNNSTEELELTNLFFSFNYNSKKLTPKAFRVFYTGTMSCLKSRTSSWGLNDAFRRIAGSQQVFSSPRYAILKDEIKGKVPIDFELSPRQKLVFGKNYFVVCFQVSDFSDLSTSFDFRITSYSINGKSILCSKESLSHPYRLAIGLRNHNDEGVYAFRIPGLLTSNKGTLLAVYDVRRNNSLDLQEDVDVGLSRSCDGGKTWEPMRIILDMGEWGGLPESQNGVGDPCILLDTETNEIYVFAIWTHGLGNNIAWRNSGSGMDPIKTAQLVYVKSKDDGRTWGAPVNITRQVKDPSWKLLLQGPGRGITMQNGTLVVPIQHIDSVDIPHAGVMYSVDKGNTWTTHAYAQTNTTEAQVVELAEGELMLNMRDNRGGSRSIFTTKDLGATWSEHQTSRRALVEPVCMASLLNIRKDDNCLNKEILLFSNPDQSIRSNRSRMTIKASLDQGNSWKKKHQLLIDEEWGWGYSCLTLIDKETIGILYEGSTSQLLFQAIKIKDIVDTKQLTD